MNILTRSQLGILCAVLVACGGVTPNRSGDPNGPESQEGGVAELAVVGVEPAAGPVGTRFVITGTGFAAEGNTVRFGDGYVKDLASADGTTIELEVPGGLDLCPPEPNQPCPGAYPQVLPGEYAVAVMVGGETSDVVTFTVTE